MRRSLPFVYIGLNIACALAVLYAGYHVTSVIRMEQRTYSDSVDGITFAVMSAPAFLLALLINILWIGKALMDAWRRHVLEAFAWLAAAGAVWAVAMLCARLI
jgi:hypothetical protein